MSESVIPAKAGIQAIERELDASPDAARLLALAEEVLEIWITARGDEPTQDERDSIKIAGVQFLKRHVGDQFEATIIWMAERDRINCKAATAMIR